MAPAFRIAPSLVPLYLLLTVLGAILKGGEAGPVGSPKVTVEIINNLVPPPEILDLTLHCKSKDDDLGFHTLKVGEKYQFSFKPNFFAVITLFYCSFTWPAETPLHFYDIYDQNRDDCLFCSYKIGKEGPCRSDATGAYVDCHPWNKPSHLAVAAWNSNATSQSHI